MRSSREGAIVMIVRGLRRGFWLSSGAWLGACAAFLCIVAGARTALGDQPCTLDQATGTVIARKPLVEDGYGSRWNAATNRVAFMQPNAAGFYRIITMRPDGTDRRDLTDGLAGFPPGHQGPVFWYPSGKYLLVAVEKPEWKDTRMFGIPDYGALPGWGCHDDLWLIAADGSRCWKLTDDPNTRFQGILMPVFSPNGRYIAWSQRLDRRVYALKVAEFVDGPEPHLGSIRTYQPGGATYYEPGSFSSDSGSLLYTSDQDTPGFLESQIYRLDLATGACSRLTHDYTYNEHPVAVSTPTGDWVVYMSTKGEKRRPGKLTLGTDWWAVRIDGTGAKRLTTMNDGAPGDPEDFGQVLVACAIAPSPTGTYMLGDVQDSLVKQTGKVLVVSFTKP